MGWNLKVNFQLRDDEVTFGDLIMDKNTAEVLSNALINIKNGGQVENFPQILEFVYTDEEFSKVKEEFKEIKEDIRYFGDLLSVKGFPFHGLEYFASEGVSTFRYVVGSNTWIDKYKTYLNIGCEAYSKLLEQRHQFTAEESAKYSKRYGEMLANTSAKERIAAGIREQFNEECVSLGIEQAMLNRIANEQDAGILNEGTVKMAESLSLCIGKAKANGAAEANAQRDAMDIERDNMAADVQEILEKEDSEIGLDTQMVIKHWCEAKKIADGNVRRLSLSAFNFISIIQGGGYDINVYDPDSFNKFKSGGVNDEEVCKRVVFCAEEFVRHISLADNSLLFDASGVVVDKRAWNSVLPMPSNVAEFKDNKDASVKNGSNLVQSSEGVI